jgi:adenine-specific DNA-methyltransferase
MPRRSDGGFRPVQYLGSKWRLLDVLEHVVDGLTDPGDPVCDLFSGSGVVAQRLARRRRVVAVDVQEYSRVITSALLCPAVLPAGVAAATMLAARRRHQRLHHQIAKLAAYEAAAMRAALAGDAVPLCDVLEHGSILAFKRQGGEPPPALAALLDDAAGTLAGGPDSVLTRYYGGLYFSYRQAAALDAIAAAARELPDPYRDTALAALLSTTSEIVSTVGSQFAQPVRPRGGDGRPKAAAVASVARKRRTPVLERYAGWLERYQRLPGAVHRHAVIRSDYRSALAVLSTGVGAIYADPPYTRDHYSRFYHVLETIALGDEPEVSKVRIGRSTRLSRALYRAERHQSPFCIRTEVTGAFRGLFEHAVKLGAPLVLSYSPYATGTAARPRPRLVTIAEITELAGEYFTAVRVESAGRIAHSKLNREQVNGEVAYDAEVLLVARP